MTRGTAATAVILALLTGLVLGQIGSFAVRPGVSRPAESNASPQSLATARSFYEAMARLLDTGDRSIESIVAPGFVDHPLSGQQDHTLQEMIDELLALRTTLPHLRVTVIDLEQRDRLIAVRLEVDPGAPLPIPGVPLVPSQPHQVFEFLRVEGGGITERWNAGQLPVATFSITTDDRWDEASLAIPGIERVVLAPGHSMHLPYGETIFLWAESGSVQLDRAGVDLEGNRRSTQDSLDAGQVRILEGGNPLTLHNVSSEQAEFWVFSPDISRKEQKALSEATATPAKPLTVAFIPLQISTDLNGSPRRLSVTLLTLPPGSTVTPHTPGIVEEIAVLSGTIEVTVDRGRALLCTGGNTANPFDGTVIVNAGSGVSANDMASLGYRVAGSQPATLLVMHIEASPTLPLTTP